MLQPFRYVASSDSSERTARSWLTGLKRAGFRLLQPAQRESSSVVEVKYVYRGEWKDVYCGDAAEHVAAKQSGHHTFDRQHRCLAMPRAKVCIHYRIDDLKILQKMPRPDGVPVQLWRSLCNQVAR